MERQEGETGKAAEDQDSREKDDLGHRIREPRLVLYLDTSAIVKKHLPEHGSSETIRAISSAQSIGTARIAQAEFSAALAKAVRLSLIKAEEGERCRRAFRQDWSSYYVAEISVSIIDRAESLAWSYPLRGYDAVHLAAAMEWQDDLGHPVTIATFDVQLWDAASQAGLQTFPENLHELIEEWTR